MPNNLALTKALYEAFGRGDIAYVMGALDSQIEWNEAENFLYSDRNPYLGPHAVLMGVMARLAGEWDGFAVVPERMLADGDSVACFGRYRGTYKATGVPVNAQFVHVFTFNDGKAVKFQQYTDTHQFQMAAGLVQAVKAS